jgi:DNA mismatch repair protein MutS
MTFRSILFEITEDAIAKETAQVPIFFVDLNLNQVIDAITAGKEEYHLKPLFYISLRNIDAIEYRHEIMRDLENNVLFEHIISFAQQMRVMREHLARAAKLHYKYQKESWFLDAVGIYCDTINCLLQNLSLVNLQSRGFAAFREFLAIYAHSSRFTSLLAETKKLKADLAEVQYCLLIKGGASRFGSMNLKRITARTLKAHSRNSNREWSKVTQSNLPPDRK